MSDDEDLRYYIVEAKVRDGSTTGTAKLGVIAATRDEAIKKARAHARATSSDGRRVTHIVSARLSQRFMKKETHT